jgi:1-acyl-sn-glycerol-3-phosphate acyltransferase
MGKLPANVERPPFEVLSWFERFAFRAMRWANQNAVWYRWQRWFLVPFVGAIVSRRIVCSGLDRLRKLPPDASILLVANHRTFFDQFVLAWILWKHGGFTQRVNFPVRATFFYENPLGLAIGMLMSGGTMFPPFFRKAERKAFNKYSLGILLEKLRTPGQIVGFHPEGKRNKSDNPYELLPAQPGAGELALKARPSIVPAFITGLSNSLWREIHGKTKVVAVFGEPIELPPIEGETRLAHHKRTADLLNDRIAALFEEEKRLRSGQDP